MIRKLILITVLALGALGMQAENQEADATPTNTEQPASKRFYMDLQCVQNQLSPKAVEIQMVVGRQVHLLTKTTPATLKAYCTSEHFTSLPEAMNALSILDWKLAQCYVTNLNGTTITHWIVFKDVQKPTDLFSGIN